MLSYKALSEKCPKSKKKKRSVSITKKREMKISLNMISSSSPLSDSSTPIKMMNKNQHFDNLPNHHNSPNVNFETLKSFNMYTNAIVSNNDTRKGIDVGNYQTNEQNFEDEETEYYESDDDEEMDCSNFSGYESDCCEYIHDDQIFQNANIMQNVHSRSKSEIPLRNRRNFQIHLSKLIVIGHEKKSKEVVESILRHREIINKKKQKSHHRIPYNEIVFDIGMERLRKKKREEQERKYFDKKKLRGNVYELVLRPHRTIIPRNG